MFLFYLVISAL